MHGFMHIKSHVILCKRESLLCRNKGLLNIVEASQRLFFIVNNSVDTTIYVSYHSTHIVFTLLG